MKNITMNGYTIKIVQDEHAESPDQWKNDDAFLTYDHRQFSVERKGFDGQEVFNHVMETKKWFYDGYFVFPVYAYIHSGVALSLGKEGYPFNDKWDTSMRGFCFVQKEKDETMHLLSVPESKGRTEWTLEEARTVAEGIVETWNIYLSGEVYGFQIEDKDGEQIDSCWGYYGEEHCLADAKDVVESNIKSDFKKRIEKVKMFIRKHVPFSVRQELLNA